MKKLLLICLISTTIFLQGCDERIAPNANLTNGGGSTNTAKTKTEFLTAYPWQVDEVSVKGGGKTVLLYSKAKGIGLKSEYADSKTTYKADGTALQIDKGVTEKATWKFLANEQQLQITPEQQDAQLYVIDLLDANNLNMRATFKKADFGDDNFWKAYLVGLGLVSTIDSFEIEVKSIPIK
jgi:hypothetical protein